MSNLRLPFLFASFVFALTFSASADAGETCQEVPSVAWWGDTSPQGLTAYVDRKHDGDWDPYLKKWQDYEENMRDILSNGKSAVVKSQGITLQGAELENHIELIARRVVATRCIASQVIEARLIESLSNMETAAGGPSEPEASGPTGNGCAKFTQVVWWETSHAKVASYVEKKHKGDWKDYVEKWDKQLAKMQSLSDRGGVAVFKSKNLRLEGEILLQYIDAIRDRLAVTKCLARREMVNTSDKKNPSANDG
jgi:hypothetical protein